MTMIVRTTSTKVLASTKLHLDSHSTPSLMASRSYRLSLLIFIFLAASAAAFSARSSIRAAAAAKHRPAAPLTPSRNGGAAAASAPAAAAVPSDGDAETENDPCSRRGFLRTAAVAGAAAAASLCAEPHAASAVEDEKGAVGYPAAPPAASPDALPAVTVASAAADAGLPEAAPKVDFEAILKKSAKRALGGGSAGASAAVVQVCSLMWLRTAMNYQYRYGGDLGSSLRTLYGEGGIQRLYQGLPFALVQGPLTRFGDTAANVGILALLESIPETAALPLPLRTAAGSVAAGLWRIVLMPVDTSKTAMQVEGAAGLESLVRRVAEGGPAPLYQGALASAAATAAGHFPWFLTYNFLNDYLPAVSKEEVIMTLVRSAFLGLSASCVSDCVSNSLRVIKTTKQTAGLGAAATEGVSGAGDRTEGAPLVVDVEGGGGVGKAKEITYREALNLVLEKDGVKGLFGRGLKTRLLTNAIQGAAFSVLWKYFQNMQ